MTRMKTRRRRRRTKYRSYKKMNLLSTKRFWKLFGKLKRTTAKKRTRRKKHRRRRRQRKIRRRTRRKRYRKHRRGGNGDDDDDSEDEEEHSHHENDVCYACEDGLEHGHNYGPDCDFVSPGMTKAQAEELDRERAEEDKNPQDS